MKFLEKRIEAWRQTMARAAGQRPELLAELESHLREEIQRLLDAGYSEEKAFEEAVSRLGSPAELATEYNKICPAQSGWLPIKIAWIMELLVAMVVGGFLILRMDQGRFTILLTVHIWSVTLGYLAMFMMGGLGICYLAARWFSEVSLFRRDALVSSMNRFAGVALPLTATGVVLGMVWAKDNLGRYWGWDAKETGGLLVLGWAALMWATRWLKPDKKPAIILMSLVGNVITAWAWFGANAVAAKSSPPALLNIFIGAHVVLLVAGLFPILRRRKA